MFNQSSLGTFGASMASTTPSTANPMKDFEVVQPPEDSISSLAFSPSTIPQNFLIAGSWDNNVRCWEIEQNGTSIPRSMQPCGGPVLDVAWSDDGTKVSSLFDYILSVIMRVFVPILTALFKLNKSMSTTAIMAPNYIFMLTILLIAFGWINNCTV